MKPKAAAGIIALLVLAGVLSLLARSFLFPGSRTDTKRAAADVKLAGSQSCRECHERFYGLWSTSFHGLAMQPYTQTLEKEKLSPQKQDVVIGKRRYRVESGEGQGWVIEKGSEGVRKYRMEHVLGGKNVFYFLTALDKGRLQTLPLAYDVNKKDWIDMAGSGVRHVPGERRSDQPVDWKDWPYTFNTACYGCHVSQLSTNYDATSGSYHTTWAEPGINCETCHGPSGEHVAAARAALKGKPLTDAKIISTRTMTEEQRNHLCASCHAKGTAPLTQSFPPGEKFFDHFDLITLEHADYYPDGRDLGENYTYTSWLMSACVKAGKLDCLHCHTSSGRYRFRKAEEANNACLPCHAERVKNAPAHTHHGEGSAGNRCISCHMPMTSFARMNRSDHSMRPPAPEATLAYQSPNACTICHGKDAQWAARQAKKWWPANRRGEALERAALIDAARKRDWRRLGEMLEAITSPERDEVFATSLIRMIPASLDAKVSEAFLAAARDQSPLVRSAAAEALATDPAPQNLEAVAAATGDPVRLVRIRAAGALSSYLEFRPGAQAGEQIQKATQEYLTSLLARPDQWASHYNLGNYQLGRGELKEALRSYGRAMEIEPQAVMVRVNASIAHARMGEINKAEESLQKALETAPENAPALFNMGLVKSELNDPKQAESYLRAALKQDPQLAPAAYNLCVLLVKDKPREAAGYCRSANKLRPNDPKYAYMLAYTLEQRGETAEAVAVLQTIVKKYPGYRDAQVLLKRISR